MRNYLLVLAIMLCGCAISSSDEKSGPVQLRIANTGTVDFDNVKVGFTSDALSFGGVAAGEYSDYMSFEVAYRYGFIEVDTPENVYRLIPIDYVGESPLKKGHYTYSLKIDDNSLILEFGHKSISPD